MPANTSPIYTKVGDIQGGITLTTAAADYTGQGVANVVLYQADADNGGYVQRVRFKALGTNVATVARFYVNSGYLNQATLLTTVSGTPTGTPSSSGGTILTGPFFAKIQAVDQYGAGTAMSTETASVSVTGPTGSIAWAWTAVTGAAYYRIFVGPVTGGQAYYFTSTTNSYTQTTATFNLVTNIPALGNPSDFLTQNNFIGEISLPATTITATAATADIDYALNFAMPPAFHLIVGLGTTVAAGWVVTVIAGKY